MDPLPHPPQLPPLPQPFHMPPFQQQPHPPSVAITAPGTITTTATATTNNAAALPPNNYSLVSQAAGAANPANLPLPTPPTTAPAPVNHTHPTYTEMIFAAITALKEKDGSSKRAIAKYIEKAYAGLPPTHAALLTHHLKRLKNTGLLVMVKKSYMLPRSDLTNNIAATIANLNNNQSQPQPLPQNQLVGPANTSPTGPLKRGRGRPPKPKPNGQQQPSSFGGQDQHVVSPDPISVGSPPVANGQQQPQTVTVSIGIADQQQLIKRRPGRPSKKMMVGPGGGSLLPVKRGRGRPPKSVAVGRAKKSAGRPRKPKSVAAASNGVKRRPGRPPKASSQQQQQQSVPVPFATTTGGVAPASAPAPAPAPASAPAPAAAATAPAGGVNVPKPRGRPRKISVPAAATAAVGVVPVKRPGRPPRAGGIVKPKKSTGRPVGRPKRKDAPLGAAGAPQSQQQAEAHTDLKRKLEFFQSTVKEAVGILKPHLTNEIAIGAVAAIQALEGLASMDINKPLSSEPQPLLQAQPPLLNSQPSALQS